MKSFLAAWFPAKIYTKASRKRGFCVSEVWQNWQRKGRPFRIVSGGFRNSISAGRFQDLPQHVCTVPGFNL